MQSVIRGALFFMGFIGVTGALIAIQPTARLRAPAEDEPVTRAQTALDEPITIAKPRSAALAPPAPRARPQEPAPKFPIAATQPQPDSDIERLVATALSGGQSGAYIDALINDAARGGMAVPARLITPEGRVDTQALIAALSDYSDAPKPAGFYTVQPGDTLATIAYRSYGRTAAAELIEEANRDTLAAAPSLLAGLRLVIPPAPET